MSDSYGENIKLTIFGESHSEAIGMVLEGLKAGERIDMEELMRFMSRRAPGNNGYSTPRKEADIPRFVCGIADNVTCGTPITALIENTNTRSSDYEQLKVVPRPGHADITANIKYGGYQDVRGGGHFSGRLTAPLCIAGGICLQLLKKKGISIKARITSVGPIEDKTVWEECDYKELSTGTDFPVADEECKKQMLKLIDEAKAKGDSVGGTIECVALGVPAGLGEPMFDGMENRIARIVFGVPAVKGLEFGAGFKSAGMFGSENNDPFYVENGQIKTRTNNAGGILGGITNGMPLTFKVAIKPTPSIAIEQESVNLKTLEPQKLKVTGRHDPCIVPRAVPCIEACAAIAIYDSLCGANKYVN